MFKIAFEHINEFYALILFFQSCQQIMLLISHLYNVNNKKIVYIKIVNISTFYVLPLKVAVCRIYWHLVVRLQIATNWIPSTSIFKCGFEGTVAIRCQQLLLEWCHLTLDTLAGNVTEVRGWGWGWEWGWAWRGGSWWIRQG